MQQLYFQRQLRESLGKDKDRLDRVWLVTDTQPIAAELLPGLKEATVLRVPADDVAHWLAPAPGHDIGEHLYVVDPLGNWMMRFPAKHGPRHGGQGQARPGAPDACFRQEQDRQIAAIRRHSAEVDSPHRV